MVIHCSISFLLFKKHSLIWLCWVLVVACRVFFSCGVWILSCSIQDQVPWPGMDPGPLALEAGSFSHCTTREVPGYSIFKSKLMCLFLPSFFFFFLPSFLKDVFTGYRTPDTRLQPNAPLLHFPLWLEPHILTSTTWPSKLLFDSVSQQLFSQVWPCGQLWTQGKFSYQCLRLPV